MNNKNKAVCADDIEEHFKNNSIKISCPKCDSVTRAKAGKYHSGVQCYKCSECGKRYSALSDTLFEETDYSWAEMVNIIYYIVTKKSIDYICKNIKEKELSKNKIWIIYHKILSILAQMPKPALVDKIWIGNIYIKESQKGTRNLYSVIDATCIRKPRNHSSNSNEDFNDFECINILCAVDSYNHFYAKCICFGKPSINDLADLEKYIQNPKCFYLDEPEPFSEWCKQHNWNFEISLNKPYDSMFYEELKKDIIFDKKNITSQYLNDYVMAYTYIKNYQSENNISSFSLKDAEDVLIKMCRHTKSVKHSPTKDEIMSQSINLLPKPDYNKIKQMQKENIKNIIDIQYSEHQHEETDKDNVEYIFDNRKFLNQIGVIRINQLVKQYNLYYKGMNKKQKIDALLELSNIDDIIYYESSKCNEETILKSITVKKKTSK